MVCVLDVGQILGDFTGKVLTNKFIGVGVFFPVGGRGMWDLVSSMWVNPLVLQTKGEANFERGCIFLVGRHRKTA